MRRICMLVLVFVAMLCFTGQLSAAQLSNNSLQGKDKWLIYLYICGNDLESGNGTGFAQATSDLEELANLEFKSRDDSSGNVPSEMAESSNNHSGRSRDLPHAQDKKSVEDQLQQSIEKSLPVPKKFPNYVNLKNIKDFPSNVKVLIQTGGSIKWFTADIPDNTIGRYIYDNRGFHSQGSFTDADMGDVNTLADFLRYGKEVVEKEFKPDHRIFIFWNHGGLAAVCYDARYWHEETYGDKGEIEESFLDLNDINEAFSKVYKSTPDNPPFEIIGFDACVRATYENANNIYGFARYMVASEENEDDCGWYYTDWIRHLGTSSRINGQKLGELICEGSYAFLEKENRSFAPQATFSVVDLSPHKLLSVRKAYENFGKDILNYTDKNPYMYGALEIAAYRSDRYAITSGGLGLTMDLKSFVENTKQVINSPEYKEEISTTFRDRLVKDADDLISAIEDAVVVNITGDSYDKSNSNGLAVYYPLNKDPKELALYIAQKSTSKHMRTLYSNMLPELPENFSLDKSNSSETSSGRAGRGKSKRKQLDELFDLKEFSVMEVQLNEDEDKVSLQLTKEQMRKLSDIRCLLALVVVEDNPAAKLGKAMGLEEGEVLFLGQSSNISREYNDDICTITDNFDASWPMLNNHPVLMTIIEKQNDTLDAKGKIAKRGYTTYGIPLLINGKEGYMLKVIQRHGEDKYQIIGATKRGKGVGRTTRGLTQLEKGDTIEPIFLAVTQAKDTDVIGKDGVLAKITHGETTMVFKYILGEPFNLETEPNVENATLPDGGYGYWFEFVSPRKSTTTSRPAGFEIYKGSVLFAEKIEKNDEDSAKETIVETEDKKVVIDTETQEVKEEVNK